MDNATPRPLYPLERNPIHIVTELVKIKVSLTSPFSTTRRTELSALYPEGPWYSLLLGAEWTLLLLNVAGRRGHLKFSKELTRN